MTTKSCLSTWIRRQTDYLGCFRKTVYTRPVFALCVFVCFLASFLDCVFRCVMFYCIFTLPCAYNEDESKYMCSRCLLYLNIIHNVNTNWECAFSCKYTVSRKNCAKLFSSELCQMSTNFDNLWQKDGKEAKIMRGYSFSTSPNLRHHTTVLNGDVSNCYAML